VLVLLLLWLFSLPLQLLEAVAFGLFSSGSVVGAALFTPVTAVGVTRAGNGERCGLVMAQA